MSIFAARWSAKPVSRRIESTIVAKGTSSGTILVKRRGGGVGQHQSPKGKQNKE